jgi:hypothetical protein
LAAAVARAVAPGAHSEKNCRSFFSRVALAGELARAMLVADLPGIRVEELAMVRERSKVVPVRSEHRRGSAR